MIFHFEHFRMTEHKTWPYDHRRIDENEYASIQEARNSHGSKMYETMDTDPSAVSTGQRTKSLRMNKCNTAPVQIGTGTAERKLSQYRYSEDSSENGLESGSSSRQYFVLDTSQQPPSVESRYSN